MAAPRKGTATPLGAVFSPEETKRAVARVAESIAGRRAELGHLLGFVADNAALVSLVNRLPVELSHEIMVPFGGAAFFPGRLIHTNELLVLLGEGYYAERSAKQTTDILHRRGQELEAQVEAMKATITDLEAEANFFESTATEASVGSLSYWFCTYGRVLLKSGKKASIATGVMFDNDREHAQIMARLVELEREEKEAGNTCEDDDDDGDDDGDAGTSEDGEENKEPGNALSDGNEDHSSGSGALFFGNGGNDRSNGNIKLKSALKKPGGDEMLKDISHTPSADTSHPVFGGQTSVCCLSFFVYLLHSVSFEDDKFVVSSSKSPTLLVGSIQSDPGLKSSSDPTPSCDRKIISSGRKAFTGSIVEHDDDDLSTIQPSAGNSLAKPGTSASSRPMSKFKMQKGGR
ncbi:Prefoldin chaperone subunit family protein [Zea mays]|uniref:Prefoldin chaperone subunit family protein n=1 Tax=Zea mays TaxID=4577 RepID=A0A1D6N2D6_MAIZE|nr:Prefoldin chaperone subunit family protein [Zea mays]